MAFKAILLCASALLVQSISGQCVRYAPSCGCSSANTNVVLSGDGGGLLITGTGPIVPSGISVSSDIGLSGNLDLSGTLPFLSAVAFEGCYPTGGSAAVSYGCGDGNIGIQNVIGGSSSGLAGINGCGCSCGV